ncbi:hypothetical protein NC652_019933 [Populus alba x Populus x berolinensis]|nr:hypothetical protein NC652_019933 [Populus alba x Populus x berolinensis]
MGVEKQAYQTRNWSQTNCWSKRDRSLHWFWEKIVISHRSFGGWDEGVMGMQVGEVARLRTFQINSTLCLINISALRKISIRSITWSFERFVLNGGNCAPSLLELPTHPLDLIKVRMQLQGESHIPNPSALQSYRPAFGLELCRQHIP